MDVRTVKVLESGVTVAGQVMNGRTVEPRSLNNCPDAPSKKLTKALESLTGMMAEMLGAPQLQGLIEVYGVTTKPVGQNGQSVVFHLKLSTGMGALAFNSHPFFKKVADETSEALLPDTALKQVAKLLGAADEYYVGPREQQSLALDGEGGDGAAAGGQ